MTTISGQANGGDEARVAALHAEFGATLAARIIESEATDFVWDARLQQRYLGQHFDVCFPPDDEDTELSRIAVLSILGGRWHVGVCLVDGEGVPADMLWRQIFEGRAEAEMAFERAR